MKILVIDVGGTNVKVHCNGESVFRKIPTKDRMEASSLVKVVKKNTTDWEYSRVSIGLPAPVVRGEVIKEPMNLAPGWMGFSFEDAFECPTKLINDAAMQALGSYEGGSMLFLGLGTGLGAALVVDGTVAPLEIAHLPYGEDRTYEDHIGLRGLKEQGRKRWEKSVHAVVKMLKDAFVTDYVVLGGGNSKKLKELPEHAVRGHNRLAFQGGFRLWGHTEPEFDINMASQEFDEEKDDG